MPAYYTFNYEDTVDRSVEGLLVRNTHYLNSKDVVRYPQTYQKLPSLNPGHTDLPGSQDPFLFPTKNNFSVFTRILTYQLEIGNACDWN